ncbi:MAG: hypothetical protein ACYTFI_20855, partial [Planctomycetota bacterium]
QAEAVEHLAGAAGHWERYARAASKLYRPQLLARTRRTDWMKLLDEVRNDVEIARRGGRLIPRASRATLGTLTSRGEGAKNLRDTQAVVAANGGWPAPLARCCPAQ